MKKIVLCPHAQDRMIERSIKKEEILDTIKNPEITIPTKNKRRKRLMRTLNNRTIDVIIEEREEIILVVTCVALNKER